MRIGIDARFFGLEHAGIGRYVMELVASLARIDKQNTYVLFLRPPYDKDLQLPDNWKRVTAKIKHYTFEEQWLMAEIFARQGLDVLHVPHFNVPLLYRKPFVVTIHDLLWHEVKGLSVTTLNPLEYLIKYVGYRLVVRHALSGARRILVPTRTIGKKLVREYQVDGRKVVIATEATSRNFRPTKRRPKTLAKYGLEEPFVIYTGSAYPHKNIPMAAQAVKSLIDAGVKLTLVIASARSEFLDRLLAELGRNGSDRGVRVLGFVPDHDLVALYASATAFIQPSRSEGFGLTGLEAMATGLPVIASNTDVLREVYGKAAMYIDPQSSQDMSIAIKHLLTNTSLWRKLSVMGVRRAREYSWSRLARKTITAYETAAKG